ncbi:hypothetical protein S101395_01758 [Bacillus sonorensis]|nr:hypothetical protein S101395_01758 [Bacillus sonorensis]TWK76238.1 hypothetical protein CHCC20335_4003 [Bacillus paralicheniformis]
MHIHMKSLFNNFTVFNTQKNQGEGILNGKNKKRDIYVAIADPTRRKLLRLLAEVEVLSLKELIVHFDKGCTAVSKHLAILKDAGLIIRRKVRQGNWILAECCTIERN